MNEPDYIAYCIFNASRVGVQMSPEGRMQRFEKLLDALFPVVPGNLLEIGCGAGLTTKIFLEAANKWNRRVLAIDPFEDAWNSMPSGYGEPYPYQTFQSMVAGIDQRLTLCRNLSVSSYAVQALKDAGQIAFAFLDGLQYQSNVVKELEMMQNAGVSVICLDDVNRLTDVSQVPLALREFLDSDGCQYVSAEVNRPLIEGYLIRK